MIDLERITRNRWVPDFRSSDNIGGESKLKTEGGGSKIVVPVQVYEARTVEIVTRIFGEELALKALPLEKRIGVNSETGDGSSVSASASF